ncbi:transcription factor A, mitochondrial [Pogonomyrmex barbatus]|uniref:Transcription factor A, mitochondrial n=1 Tax=Pogonomyrmex barbatus TaxID=144034 RepID=A0A6I9W462_9HYME|nr:transcription factor A, mitochondrial [Pogonomyrmex barbatus]
MFMATYRLMFPINGKQFNPLTLSCIRKFTSAQDFTTSKGNVEENPLPPKPKKPLNIFVQYVESIKDKLLKEYPDYKHKDILKKASEKWAQIDPKIKQDLKDQYLEQNSIYKQKLIDYENSLSDKQKMQIKELQKKRQIKDLKRSEIKQKLIEFGKPKHPLTSFMLFLRDKRLTKNPQVPYKDWMNNVTEEWKNITIEIKNKYNAEAKELIEKYKIDMKKWKEDMIRAGHHNIVKPNIKHKSESLKYKE